MLEIISNGSKWYGQKPDSIDVLLQRLSNHSLDPTFEDYGNFVNRNPKWLKKEVEEKYNGCTIIHGNFAEYSHVFNIITDDNNLIEMLVEAIDKNKSTEEYKKYRKEYIESEHRKERAIFLFNKGRITQKEMYEMIAGVI